MGAQQNKVSAQNGYAAFGRSDAESAIANIDESIAWTVRGDNALTGTHNGKQAVGELWGKLMEAGFSVAPHDFIADSDKVIVLTTVKLDGETNENADVLTYSDDGKLIAFDTVGDTSVTDRVFAR